MFFLITITLIACTSPVSPPRIDPTDVVETSMVVVQTIIAETMTAVPTGTATFSPPVPSPIPSPQPPYFATPVDLHDPEAVLRAYFEAWDRQDWDAMAYLERDRAPEPVEFVRILELKKISSSPTKYVYEVRFEIQVKGQGVSMHTGQYLWTYFLTWVPNRDMWYISNYGH